MKALRGAICDQGRLAVGIAQIKMGFEDDTAGDRSLGGSAGRGGVG